MKKNVSKTKILEGIASELLSLMTIKAEIKVSDDKENEALVIDVAAPEEAGLLIGRHGETLNSLQTILGLILKEKTGEWSRVVVNVGDWREREEEKLKELAYQTAGRAKETGEPQPLYNLSASQRRIVHLALQEDSHVATESEGEGSERYLVVKPKKK